MKQKTEGWCREHADAAHRAGDCPKPGLDDSKYAPEGKRVEDPWKNFSDSCREHGSYACALCPRFGVYSEPGFALAYVYDKADADLFNAAKDLLAVAVEVKRHLAEIETMAATTPAAGLIRAGIHQCYGLLRVAIAKAEGRPE